MLHSLQQLCAGVSFQLFFHHCILHNPNIYPPEEITKRAAEQKRLISQLPAVHPITYLEGSYDPQSYYQAIKGHEQDREGGERCFLCYHLRLKEAAKLARSEGYDYFTTTLSISPLKNADKLNEIGEELAKEYGVAYLSSDFKKKNGYQRSIELSREHELYRQDYCGCVFSQRKK